MNALSQRASDKIANLGLLCSLIVVLIHVNRPEMRNGAVATMVNSVLSVAVPYFFLVSGFFVMRRSDERDWWRAAVVRRCRTLLVPYFLWLVVGLASVAGADMLHNWLLGRPPFSELRGFCGSGRGFFGLRPDFPPGILPLWYLRCLFLLIVLSPVVKFCLTRCLVPYLALLLFLTMAVDWAFARGMLSLSSSWGRFLAFGFSVKGALYFSVGAFLALRVGVPRREGVDRWKPVVLSSVIGCGAVGLLLSDWTVVLSEMASPCILALAWILVPARPLRRITWLSFPIFLLHAIVIEFWHPVAECLRLERNWANCLAMWLTCLVVSVLVACCLRFCSERAAGWAFGGRT